MSEPSILDYASTQGTDEVAASAGQRIQTLISMVTEQVTSRAHQRTEKARAAAARSEAEQRRLKQQEDALYDADRLVWRRVWHEEFWEKAAPERIARAWEAAAAWATDEFPAAKATIEHMRAELAERYGITVDPVEVRGAELAALLGGAADPQPDSASPSNATTVATDPGARERLDTITYRLHGPDGHTETGVVHLAADDGTDVARQIAAERLTAYQAEHDGWCGIEMFAGDRIDPERRLLTLDSVAAQEMHDRYSTIVAQPREADARAAESAEGGAEVAAVLRTERHRLRGRLTALSNGEDAAFADAPDDPGERQSWARDRAEDTRAQLGRLGTRLQAVEADLRGEDGDVVVRWAALRYELDEQWWQTATRSEAAAVWDQVASWAPGRSRDQALAHLRSAVHRQFEVILPEAATGDQVRDLLTGRAPSAESAAPVPGPDAAAIRHAPTEQDTAAAEVYEQMSQDGDPVVVEAAKAATTVAQAYTAKPSDRVADTAQKGAQNAPVGASQTRGPRQENDPLSR
ncbi:hypothetical protein [Actinomadura sp. B10D3]|uniref:hypothetical protein n=1 Tax=Actinomadura sp. B10D3 TaxID=3153557 RepID=UPI00325C54DD